MLGHYYSDLAMSGDRVAILCNTDNIITTLTWSAATANNFLTHWH
jgi:hypothetical protein